MNAYIQDNRLITPVSLMQTPASYPEPLTLDEVEATLEEVNDLGGVFTKLTDKVEQVDCCGQTIWLVKASSEGDVRRAMKAANL